MTKFIHDKEGYPVIVTAANEAYAVPLAVMLKSLELKLTPGSGARIYILNNGLTVQTKTEIENCIVNNRISLIWKEISPVTLLGLKIDGHISVDTYFRLLIEDAFPQYNKIIYLDADLVINMPIDKLWNEPVGDNHLLAVPMFLKKSAYVCGERGLPSYKLLGIPAKTRTFNAGVMVLNLKKWRADGISEQVMAYLGKYKDFVLWWDQDGLNAVLYDKWRPMPAGFNVMTCHLSNMNDGDDALFSESEYQDVQQNPGIIHFAGPEKPWLSGYSGPFLDNFLKIVGLLPSSYLKGLFEINIDKLTVYD